MSTNKLSPNQRNNRLLVPPPPIPQTTSPRNSIDGRNGMVGIQRQGSINTGSKRSFGDYHFPSQASSVNSTPSVSRNNLVNLLRNNSVNNEYVIDLMEREQDGIVLKLMKEIDSLKQENKLLRNGGDTKDSAKKKLKVDGLASFKNEADDLKRELVLKDTALEQLKLQLMEKDKIIKQLKKEKESD